MDALNNVLTDDIISNFANGTYRYVVTQESILNSLNDRLDSFNSFIIFLIMLIFLSLIMFFYFIIKQKHLIKIIVAFLLACLLGLFTYQEVCEKNAIEYSIANNCWSIERDLVIGKFIEGYDSGNLYCLQLKYYGKIAIFPSWHENSEKDDDVYVVCVQDKSGKKYPVSAWPFKETLFIESLPLH